MAKDSIKDPATDPTANVPATQEASKGLPGIANLTGDLAAEFEDAAGAGASENVADRGTPLIYLAQKSSKQVDKQNALFVKGLEVGMAFNSLTNEFWDAEDEGLDFLPCFFRANWVEWTPRDSGGGFHGMHPFCSLQEAKDKYHGQQNGDRADQLVLENGHELHLTHHYYGILPQSLSAVIIPMASTNLKASQQMQALINNARVSINNKLVIAPAYILPWKMKSVYASNEQGNWYRWSPSRVGSLQDQSTYTDPMLRNICRELFKAVQADNVKMAQPMSADGGSGSSQSEEKVPI